MTTSQGAPNIAHARAWLKDAVTHLCDLSRTHNDQRLADLAVTLNDIAVRASLPVDNGAIVVMTETAIEAHANAVRAIGEAHAWAQGADLTWEIVESGAGERIVARRREQANDMELSLHRCFARLLTVAQSYDGPVTVWRDGDVSFGWRHVQSGYHGGIIYHASYANDVRLPVGTWSTHT